MLPVVVAASKDQPILGPDDLGADVESRTRSGCRRRSPRAGRRARHRRRRREKAPRPRASPPGRHSRPCRCAWSLPPGAISPGWIVFDAIGRVGDHQSAGARRSSARSTVAASVLSPQTSRWRPRTRHRPEPTTGFGQRFGHVVRIGQARSSCSAKSAASSSTSKPTSCEFAPIVPQIGQFDPEQGLVPPGVERELVVGQHIGAALRLGPAARHDHGHFGQAQLAGGEQAAMASDDTAVLVDQDRDRSSRTRGCWRRSARPARRSGCGRCARMGSADRAGQRSTLSAGHSCIDYPLVPIRG